MGGLMRQDEKLQDWFQQQRSSTSKRVSMVIEPLGAEGAVIALGSVYLSGYLLHDITLKRVALLCGESALISGVIGGTLKILLGRARPYTEEGAYSYSPFNIHGSHQSLPSVHTSTAFALASCLADEYENTLVGVIGYGVAIMIGLSRIHDNEHWVSDVFLGSVVGIGVGRTISKLHKKIKTL
jgi:membrane-associated phospholipid phosphatase